MRKFLIFIAVVLFSFMAQAGTYNYLVFTNTSGVNTALRVADLAMTINGTELQITNADGVTAFTLTDLASMQFSETEELTALSDVLRSDVAVEAYSVTGHRHGAFSSLLEAAKSLPQGVYVITDGINAQKIIVR